MYKKRKISLGVIVFCIVIFLVRKHENTEYILRGVYSGECLEKDKINIQDAKDITIVIDPGHGGYDPGKVGENGVQEKKYNLEIGYKVKKEIEDAGMNVVMTRYEDVDLSGEKTVGLSQSRKTRDLNKRVNIINQSEGIIAISIHQNSFTDKNVKGAQVFFYSDSEEGEEIAKTIHEKLVHISADNDRDVKANKDYYILRNSVIPTVIIECGFLSNADDVEKLEDDNYQNLLAKGIAEGIIEYINKEVL